MQKDGFIFLCFQRAIGRLWSILSQPEGNGSVLNLSTVINKKNCTLCTLVLLSHLNISDIQTSLNQIALNLILTHYMFRK